jgi:3-phenylpropionate/trans-cinnamate dioxygenase ferredoxin reductase component
MLEELLPRRLSRGHRRPQGRPDQLRRRPATAPDARGDRVTEARSRVVVIGAGHAGGTFVALIRQAGFTGEAVVGGGYVGLEVAAAARQHGARTTVIEREGRVLPRVASPTLSAIIESHHAARGTAVLIHCLIRAFRGTRGQLRAVTVCADGGVERDVACDVAVVGVGAVPRDELARDAGLACDNGIVVDGGARTGDSRILAIGDVTSRPVRGIGDRMRLESIPSAVEQAGQAVATIMGTDHGEPEVPWFWSDQFGLPPGRARPRTSWRSAG